MKAISIPLVLLACVFTLGTANAGKPTKSDGSFLGNGYPSGPHFNLKLIAKWDHNFICPPQEYYLSVTECTCGNHSAGDLVESCQTQRPDRYCAISGRRRFS